MTRPADSAHAADGINGVLTRHLPGFVLQPADSDRFARLSGDFNPLHVDPVAARRLQFGGTVCHGVHLVLKALDTACAAGHLALDRLQTISAVFSSSVRTGMAVDLLLTIDNDGQRLRLAASTPQGQALFTARLALADQPLPAGPPPPDAAPEATTAAWQPEYPAGQAMPALAGQVPLVANRALLQALLPALVEQSQGPELTADLMATTRIVGMRCPGLHSIYSEFKLQRRSTPGTAADAAQMPQMPHAVKRADARFRSVRIAVAGGTLEGHLQAFFRAPPVAQPLLADLLGQVAADRFAGQRALVVGGSRGLGELVAKLLLAGGAEVTLTYARGQADAERIVAEATAASGQARALQLDASQPLPAALLATLAAGGFSHVYHFATPTIGKSPGGRWSPALFADFCQFYLNAFEAVVRAAASPASAQRPLTVLYPSTVFLDPLEKGFAEYTAAKAAGETLCGQLNLDPALRVHAPRLPRLQTDQNSSFMGVEGEAPLPVMLALLQSLHPAAGSQA